MKFITCARLLITIKFFGLVTPRDKGYVSVFPKVIYQELLILQIGLKFIDNKWLCVCIQICSMSLADWKHSALRFVHGINR